MIDLDAIIAEVTGQVDPDTRFSERFADVIGGFWYQVDRRNVGEAESVAWQHVQNQTGASWEDRGSTSHTKTHWRFFVLSRSSPPPSPDYYARLKEDYIAWITPIVREDPERFLALVDGPGDTWAQLAPLLSEDLRARLSKPSWVGNRPGLVGYYLRMVAKAAKPIDLDAIIAQVKKGK
jgi:hypothetical protein